jgi:hypothetical protein
MITFDVGERVVERGEVLSLDSEKQRTAHITGRHDLNMILLMCAGRGPYMFHKGNWVKADVPL